MGLDIYIEARIKETATGRCISIHDQSYCKGGKNYRYRYNPDDDRNFTVFWRCGSSAYPLLHSWIEIINRYTNSSYNTNNFTIPFPQSALREMCSCLYSYGCVPEENRFQWDLECGFWDVSQREKKHNIPYSTEKPYEHIDWDNLEYEEYVHLYWAKRLREFIYFLERIHYENKYVPLRADNDGLNEDGEYIFVDEFIEEFSDLQAFKENPQAYTWEFEIFNSY